MSDYNIPVSGGVNGLNVPLHGHIAVYNKEFPVIPNPEGEATGYVTKLGFTPEILQIKDPEVHDWARAEEKPTYTKAEVGLGNVDNTSDLNKPISTATQTALDGKVDKVPGKALSTNDYTDTDKTIVDGVTSALATKVDKIAGKGLSSNDYTDYEKTKLAYIQSGAEANVQADWFEANRWSDAFILNKPTKLSDFDNDEGFIDKTVNNLDNYYKKTETYTQSEVNSALSGKVDNSTLDNYYTKTETDTALGNKVDKAQGKGLSTNDYDDTAKGIVDGVTTALLGKVDKEEGYGLSENDYTDEEKAKVGEIDNKLDKTETAVNSNGLVIATPVTDNAPYIYRQTPVKESFKALMKKIVGASVVWNQLVQNGNFASTDYWSDIGSVSKSVSNNILSITASRTYDGVLQNVSVVPNHKHILFWEVKSPDLNAQLRCANVNITISPTIADTWQQFFTLVNANISTLDIRFRDKASEPSQTQNFRNAMLVDLTAMFGTTIADYVYTLETSQSGSGIAWLQSYGFFPEDYYAYKQNKLESGCVSAHKTYDGETLLTNTELSPITLRGLFKLSTDKLTVDGDEYNADGSVTRKWIEYNMADLQWDKYTTSDLYGNLFFTNYFVPTTFGNIVVQPTNVIHTICSCFESVTNSNHNGQAGSATEQPINALRINERRQIYVRMADGVTLEQFNSTIQNAKIIFEKTPTTEQTTPFTETEIVGSTEEFIDYEVAQGNRDVDIPVGTETDYYQEMKLPSLPTTSGNHNLIYNVATGFGWS